MENNFQRYITGLQHIGIPTNDLEATIAFYETFGFQVAFQTVNEAAGERVAFLRMGMLRLRHTTISRRRWSTGRWIMLH